MDNDELEEELTTVARHLLAHLLELYGGECWEDYPDLGERDWDAVLARARSVVGRSTAWPTRAYDALAERADH